MSDEMTLWAEEEGAVRSSEARKKKETKTRSTTSTTKKYDNKGGEVGSETTNSEPAGVQITERDCEVLGWIADQYAVRTDVVRWLLGNGSR